MSGNQSVDDIPLPHDTRIRTIINSEFPFGGILKEFDPLADGKTRQPEISTGWWNDRTTRSQITVTDPEKGVVDGGNTSITSIVPSGGIGKRWNGFVSVDAWVHSEAVDRRVTQAVKDANRDSTKQVAYMLSYRAKGIIDQYYGGYRDPDTNKLIYGTLATDDVTRLPTPDNEDLQRYQFRAVYNYSEQLSRTE